MARNVLILGAAGRDFHDFNMFYRDTPAYRVVGFTATQIPDIAGRKYPRELAGKLYPKGIPIFEEKDMERLIRDLHVNEVVFAYSDVPHERVMHLASRAIAAGASFTLLGPQDTMLKSRKKIISVCAVRTGAGKSPLSREISNFLREKKIRFVLVRHPMPYGDLKKEVVERFASLEDLDRNKCTIEEREDYEPHIRNGAIVYAGVDYEKILHAAEKEADLIIWDGGNNDLPFFRPDLAFVVADALRPGHELRYHPGEANFRMADVIVISKASANRTGAKVVAAHAKEINPKARVIESDLLLTEEGDTDLRGRRVIVIEDGPTVTHGGMAYGAGYEYAVSHGAIVLEPGRFAVGMIKDAFVQYPHLRWVLPAVGYSEKEIRDLQETINRSNAELVVSGTPTDIRRVLKAKIPIVHIRYEMKKSDAIRRIIAEFIKKAKLAD
jgi:predicted GTPase